jgi:tetratricopeptide (TPR) repeat protein
MKTPLVVVLTVLVSAATSALVASILSRGSRAPSAATESASPTDLDEIRRELSRLRQSLENLESSTQLSRPEPQSRSSAAESAANLSADDVRTIVDRALAEHAGKDQTPTSAPMSVATAMQRLLDPNLSEDERVVLWASLAQSGMLDAVLAEYERRATAAPMDSTAQADLGFAYLQKMRNSQGGPEAGIWGKKGSDAYAKAIELDEMNWDARFAQAQHLYYADLSTDALHHLNVLRSQQRSRRSEVRHADAFVFLGNVYMEQGNTASAIEVWKEGLALFPSNERLRVLVQAVEEQ